MKGQMNDEVMAASFTAYLHRHRMKGTPERMAVLRLCRSFRGHFMTQQVLDKALEEKQPICRATVFATLKILVEWGYLEKVSFPGRTPCYQAALRHGRNQRHIVCNRCGRIADIPLSEEMERALSHLDLRGFDMESYELQLTGMCARCKKKKTNPLVKENRYKS